MDLIALVGRLLFVLVFLGSGAGHLTNTAMMTGYAESKKLPAAKASVLVSGLWIIVAGLMILFGVWIDLAALMLFVFLLGAAFIFHNFWAETDPQSRMTEMTQFMKDLALAGASLCRRARPGSSRRGSRSGCRPALLDGARLDLAQIRLIERAGCSDS